MADNLKGIPISSLPKADELVADDQLIAYREDNGKAYRANVGTLGEAAESNLSDAFSTSKTYSAGEYVIYNDTLWKFTADKDAGEWDESVVEKTTMGTEIGEINQSLTDFESKFNNVVYRIGTIDSSYDLNDLKTSGLYGFFSGSMPANIPTSGASVVLVFSCFDDCSVQFCIQYNTSSMPFYYRVWHDSQSQWREWKQIS